MQQAPELPPGGSNEEEEMVCHISSEPELPPILFICLLILVGFVGVALNGLVILGVRSNRKLNTSINHLLLWLCAASLLEATLGILAKCIIIGGVVSNVITKSRIRGVCRSLLTLPFFFAFTSQLMLTCVSLYRLYLVIRSVRGQPQPSRATKTRVTRLLPLFAAIFGLAFAVWSAIWSEPMLLQRLCMGNCDEYDNIYQNAVVLLLLMLPTC